MKEEKFDMMMGILKILEKKNDPEITQSILEIVDSYDERLTPEQKAKVLDGFLRFRNGSKRGYTNSTSGNWFRTNRRRTNRCKTKQYTF